MGNHVTPEADGCPIDVLYVGTTFMVVRGQGQALSLQKGYLAYEKNVWYGDQTLQRNNVSCRGTLQRAPTKDKI